MTLSLTMRAEPMRDTERCHDGGDDDDNDDYNNHNDNYNDYRDDGEIKKMTTVKTFH